MMSETDPPLVWIKGEVKTPPFSADARIKAGSVKKNSERGIAGDAGFQADVVAKDKDYHG